MIAAICRKSFFTSLLLTVSFFIAFSTASSLSYASTITVVNLDGPNEGFNDTTAWTPVGGNNATTLGQARLNAFQFAANIWGSILESSVEIKVGAHFDPMTPCDPTSAVLGSAGPTTAYRDFTGAILTGTWYVKALANALYGSDLSTATNDISATFNSSVDNSSCLGSTDWYYGYDGNGGGDIDFVTVVLHEMAHGLGFLTFVNLNTGAKAGGYNDAYMVYLEHHGATPSDYPSMTNAQRIAASISVDDLHWVGPNVKTDSAGLTGGKLGDHVFMYAPNPNQSGSSVSHWDTTLSFNQLMEPSYTGIIHDPWLELALFKDIGWNINPTFAGKVGFKAFAYRNNVILEWETNSEIGTAGFYLYRFDEKTGKYVNVNGGLIPGLLNAPQGGTYRCIDKGAGTGGTYTYKLVEVEAKGRTHTYGPYTVRVGREEIGNETAEYTQAGFDIAESGYSRKAHMISAAKKARIAAKKTKGKLAVSGNVGDKIRIEVERSGLYYVDASEIAGARGKPASIIKKWIRQKSLILQNQEDKVAWLPANGNSGIYFYGEAVDSIYTNKNIYRLRNGKNGEGLVMAMAKGKGPDPKGAYQTFAETVHAEEDNFAWTSPFFDPESDYWMWDYIIADDPHHSGKDFSIRTDGLAEANTAVLKVHLQGVSSARDHHVVVNLNGTRIGEGYWAGSLSYELVIEFNHSLLHEGENTITVNGLLDTGAPYSIFFVDSFDLTYRRYYKAVDNRLFVKGDENDVITVTGFTNDDIFVFGLGDPKKPRKIAATTVDKTGSGYQVSFTPESRDELYLVLAGGASGIPLSITGNRSSNLRQKKNRADYLIITTSELREMAQTLANYRQSQGLRSMVVDVEDIMNEFNYGLYKPEAIRDFLSYAYHNWEKAPRYLVLAGEGTFDYKNNQGYNDNLVPAILVETPYGLFASDNRYADVDGDDGVPDMAVGRLPVMTSEELDAVISKITAYETAGGNWTKRILLVADDPDDGGDFPAQSDVLAHMLTSDYLTEKIYLSERTISEARQRVLNGIKDGVLLLNYVGHADLDSLAQEGILLSADVDSLGNGDKLPIITAMTCLTGLFSIPGYDSLGEIMVLQQSGGAIATWAPTGLSINSAAATLNEGFFRAAFIEHSTILGDVLLRVLKDYAFQNKSPYMLDIYTLLGDPALRIR